MVRNADNEPVVRDIELHHAAAAIFLDQNIFQFHLVLVAELIFKEEADVPGAHVADAGQGFESKIFGGVGPGINNLKARPDADIGLQAPEGDFLILQEAGSG